MHKRFIIVVTSDILKLLSDKLNAPSLYTVVVQLIKSIRAYASSLTATRKHAYRENDRGLQSQYSNKQTKTTAK
jgi:hypothetical protein